MTQEAVLIEDGKVIDDGLTLTQRKRLRDREEWKAYWELRDLTSQNTWLPRMQYHLHRYFDKPATWFREKVVEPLHDKYQLPYYHRRLDRVPEIDQCGVLDHACYYEANEQYRLDKLVDFYIVQILQQRLHRCIIYNPDSLHKCVQAVEDFEHAELNFFIKYGELGCQADVKSAYMKQKHRMIWERRHPEVMAERERKYQEYLEQKKAGHFDMSFWKKGLIFEDKKNASPVHSYGVFLPKPVHESDQPLSRDWEYYKKVANDPEFDKDQGRKTKIPLF